MKKIYLLLLLLLPFLLSCKNECDGIDCVQVASLAFTIKSSESGEDLLFGPNPKIKQHDVAVFYTSQDRQQTVPLRFESDHVSFGLGKGVREYFINALGKTDTLYLNLRQASPSECCPSNTNIERVSLNSTEVDKDSRIILYR